MIKKFLPPKLKYGSPQRRAGKPMFFSGFFCGFQRCGSAAFPNFRGGTSSPPAAAKCVRTNLRILHQKGIRKFERFAPHLYACNFFLFFGGVKKIGTLSF